jgi:hypothetical protein
MPLPNVRVESMTLQDFAQLASRQLAVKISVSSPLKICDFKPAYGDIFSVADRDLDFWGYCDVDLIFGNMRQFLDDVTLCKFDIISAAKHFMAGPFSLFRNAPSINSLYRQSAHVLDVLQTRELKLFDELGPYIKWKANGDFLRKRGKNFESFTDVVNSARDRDEVRALFGLRYYNDPDTAIHKYTDVLWRHGDLVDIGTNNNFLMYHFQMGKRSFRSWHVPSAADWSNGLLITRNGFYRARNIR